MLCILANSLAFPQASSSVYNAAAAGKGVNHKTMALQSAKEALRKDLQTVHGVQPFPQYAEAIDGVTHSLKPKGQPLKAKLIKAEVEALSRAARAAAEVKWQAWMEPAAMAVAHEYIDFVEEMDVLIDDAREEYLGPGISAAAAIADASASRWTPSFVLRRVAASKLLDPPLTSAMAAAAEAGLPSPLSVKKHTRATWDLFTSCVGRLVREEFHDMPDERRTWHWRLLRRLRQAHKRELFSAAKSGLL